MTTYAYYIADLTRDRTASHGIINYSLGLLSGLAETMDRDEKLVVLGNAGMKAELAEILPDLARLDWFLADEPGSVLARLRADHLRSLRWAAQAGAAVLHFPKGFIPFRKSRHIGMVATIHDDIPIRYAAGDFGAEAVSRKSRYFAASIRHTLRRADAVLAVSDFTKGRLEEEFPDHRAPIHVTHEGPHPFVTRRGHTWPKDNHLLVFGSTHPHKRTETTIEFATRYLESSAVPLELVVLGSVTPEVDARIAALPQARRERQFLDSADLADLVSRSRALLWGSAYEGFGLPPLEAGLLGTPVVYRQIPAVDEVMGSTHFPFSDSYESFVAALDDALAADEERLIGYGQTLSDRFQWTDVAARTLTAYRQAL